MFQLQVHFPLSLWSWGIQIRSCTSHASKINQLLAWFWPVANRLETRITHWKCARRLYYHYLWLPTCLSLLYLHLLQARGVNRSKLGLVLDGDDPDAKRDAHKHYLLYTLFLTLWLPMGCDLMGKRPGMTSQQFLINSYFGQAAQKSASGPTTFTKPSILWCKRELALCKFRISWKFWVFQRFDGSSSKSHYA